MSRHMSTLPKRTTLLLTITAALAGALPSASALEKRYTELPEGGNTVALGYPVPLPVDSLTPVAGFRSYNSLHARHQQLASNSLNVHAATIGNTYHGRPIWAYRLSDVDQHAAEGFVAEGGMLQNGGIHAREWQSPEVVTSIFETLIGNETDQGLHQYLLENAEIVLIPVFNIDGFLQTQRFPDRFMATTFSEDPGDWPRDGRMRRKNMRDVDEQLATESDNLFGVDLNRNNNPWWASSNRSSGNVRSLVYHGAGPASEPETQALQNAVNLFAETTPAGNQLRFYIDTHSFSKLYYLARNGNSRRDDIAVTLGQQMAAATGNNYIVSPDPVNSGIGTTDEYFAYTHNVPAYTLEIEPANSSMEYGGLGVSHDGFILPASQIARVRTELTRASLLGYYKQSGAPVLLAAEVREVLTDSLLADLQWTATSSSERRKTRTDSTAWQPGQRYQLTLDFNKPMRVRNNLDAIVNYQGQNVALAPSLQLVAQHRDGSTLSTTLSADNSGWCQVPACRRYDSDRYQIEFDWPSNWIPNDLVNVRLGVTVTDFAGNGLDSDPATVVFWQQGSWQGYESSASVTGDVGGSDNNFYLLRTGEPPVYNGGISVPTLQVGQALNYQFPSTAFTDPDGGTLSYELRSDPTPLPSWLQFDAANRRLTGTPPSTGTVSAQIVAIDADGNRAIAPITISVSQPSNQGSSGGGGGGVLSGWLLLLMALAGIGARRVIR